jgi:signal peptidase
MTTTPHAPTGATTPSTVRRTVADLAGWVLVLALLALAWPTTLGGATGYVVVSGHSMEPTYYTGDLVITRSDAPVRPGSVIVYTVPEGEPGAGLPVVHRVLRNAPDGGWVTQGDNNPSIDPWTPTAQDVSGTVVAHLPKAGYVLVYAKSPLVLAAAGALVVGWILWPRQDTTDTDTTAPRPDTDTPAPDPAT